jgi:hypothetical protein
MFYLIPPTEREPQWRIRSVAPISKERVRPDRIQTVKLTEDLARVFAEAGVPSVFEKPIELGASEEALVRAKAYFEGHSIRLSNKLRKTLEFELSLFDKYSMQRLPKVFHDCRRAAAIAKEAQLRYETLHEEVLSWAIVELNLPDNIDLVEGPHDCTRSPIRRCLYDNEKDSMHDQCLVCGEPEERK